MSGGHGSEDRGLPLESALALVAEAVRRVVAEEIALLKAAQEATEASGANVWGSKPVASRKYGISVAALSRAQASGELSKGRNGRVHFAEVAAWVAKADERAPQAPPVPVLNDERMKRVAAEIRRSFDKTGGGDV